MKTVEHLRCGELRALLSLLWLLVAAFWHAMPAQYVDAPIDSLIQRYEQSDPDLVEIDLISEIAMRMTQIDPYQGLEYAQKAVDLAKKRNATQSLAGAYNSLGANYLLLTDIPRALEHWTNALAVYEEIEDKKGMADILGNMGHLHYYTGNFDEALDHYFRALWIYEELEFTQGIANQHASVANIYDVQEKFAEAIHHDTLALQGFRDAGDKGGEAMVLGNLGNIYAEIDSTVLAISYCTQAIELYRQLETPEGIGRNLVNLASINLTIDKYRDALEISREALAICGEANQPRCVAYSLANIGSAYLQSAVNRDSLPERFQLIAGTRDQLLREAIRYLEQALDLPPEMETPEGIEEWHALLSQAYEMNGQYENALQHYQLYVKVQDSLESLERIARIERLTTEREIAVRDKQIELDTLRLKVKRNERVYFGIGIVLLLGMLVFIYRNFVNQKKSNVQLGLLNTQISDTNLQLEDKNEHLSRTLTELKETQAQLIEAERQKENEILRRRISRDIHDDISSGLTKISWMTESMKSGLSGNDDQLDHSTLEKISTYARDTVAKLGEIIWSTKPESDNVAGLLS
ncbi:MAG: tetratricopeptide repeat protein, partial [Saprospiraceae bacterium]|nr:tetratricopeptide repeat protein [Saprospiraceae bacterium]